MKNLLILVILFTVLCSCGFRGPLYLPKKVVASSPQKSKSLPTNDSVAVQATNSNISTESESLYKESSIIK